jgi:[ribosomal protein S18]-alanine N-acetyltransferase
MLRPAHAHEARVMAEMSRTLIEAGLGWRYTPRRMAALMADSDTVALVAHDASRLQGFAVMQFGDEQAHLVLLCVQPALRQRGIGRRLTQWLLESARVAGIASVGLELRADNAGAMAFYQRLGFSPTQEVAGYYDGSVSARRMRLQLRPPAP